MARNVCHRQIVRFINQTFPVRTAGFPYYLSPDRMVQMPCRAKSERGVLEIQQVVDLGRPQPDWFRPEIGGMILFGDPAFGEEHFMRIMITPDYLGGTPVSPKPSSAAPQLAGYN